MTLNILHTISGLLIIIFFISKVILHYYLDYKHHRTVSFIYSLAAPIQYFQPYKRTVEYKFLKLQRVCNLLLTLTFLALLLNIFLGVSIYFKTKWEKTELFWRHTSLRKKNGEDFEKLKEIRNFLAR